MMPFCSDSNISYRQEPGRETLAVGPSLSWSQLPGKTTASDAQLPSFLFFKKTSPVDAVPHY